MNEQLYTKRDDNYVPRAARPGQGTGIPGCMLDAVHRVCTGGPTNITSKEQNSKLHGRTRLILSCMRSCTRRAVARHIRPPQLHIPHPQRYGLWSPRSQVVEWSCACFACDVLLDDPHLGARY